VTPDQFIKNVRLMTGTEIKGEAEIDKANLASILAEDLRRIDCSQFNELLLLVHKDRVEAPFFEYFFGQNCTVAEIANGVAKFQRTAMLRYGNFIFAFRSLSRLKDEAAFRIQLADLGRDPANELKRFRDRRPKLIEIDRIAREHTPYVGYLTAGQIKAEHDRCELLTTALQRVDIAADLNTYLREVESLAGAQERPVLTEIIESYRKRFSAATLEDLKDFLTDSLQKLAQLYATVKGVRRRAIQNQNVCLTWDHMDVYFATSMRKAWEYEDLYDFIDQLMSAPGLKELDIRYFDPTQSFTDNRINKGLVEALMLKRARCTVYSVQDTDTLGKDSELASTLAQGKPVIAYVPDIDVEKRAEQLLSEEPATILERLRFVLYADENLPMRLSSQEYDLLGSVQDHLVDFISAQVWLSLPDVQSAAEFKSRLTASLRDFCRIVARSEKAVYDKRAKTLRESHPLAIQVNLDTGVANGVLVVRTVADCATLLRRILLGEMEFRLEEKDHMWYLREEISGCVYRVVTSDRKLNNSFWNFYLR
jgi:hypothetical protein